MRGHSSKVVLAVLALLLPIKHAIFLSASDPDYHERNIDVITEIRTKCRLGWSFSLRATEDLERQKRQ
jgi:hypothetical protein